MRRKAALFAAQVLACLLLAAAAAARADAWSVPHVAPLTQPAAVVAETARGAAMPHRSPMSPGRRIALASAGLTKDDGGSRKAGVPYQIGFSREVEALRSIEGLRAHLDWREADGGSRAALSITAAGAAGLRLGMLVRHLPERALIRLYAPGAELAHVFSGEQVNAILKLNTDAGESGEAASTFWFPVVEGEEAVFEVFLPAGLSADALQVSIPRISHLYELPTGPQAPAGEIEKAGSCNLDATCYSDWLSVSNATARMTFVGADGYSYLCSGTLLNDTASSRTPYFLSAYHCISVQSEASSLQTYWFYRSQACNGATTNPGARTLSGGAVLLYTAATTDTAFLKLNSPPPAGAVFAAWTSGTPVLASAATGLHHPGGELQKISFGTIDSFQDCSRSVGEGVFQCQAGGAGNSGYINIIFSQGTTEGGSSGSGIFVMQGGQRYLVGQLRGGSSSCANRSGNNFYGRFDLAYAGGMGQWLNPASPPPPPPPPADGGPAAYNIPSPQNPDQPFIRLYNPSSSAGAVRGILYDQNGNRLGRGRVVLVPSLAAKAVKVLTAAEIASAFGVSTWPGRAWMELEADFSGLRAMNLIRSSLLLNMSCVDDGGGGAYYPAAYYIPSPDAASEQAYVRLYNPWEGVGSVSGTLYNEGGRVIGRANAVLVNALPGHAVAVLRAADIAAAVGVSAWSGRAWLSITSPIVGLKVMNTLRDMASDLLLNLSCLAGTSDSSADILNIPGPSSTTTAAIRIYNTGSVQMSPRGTLYGENGAVLGAPSGLGAIPPKGVLVIDNVTLASRLGAGAWPGRAWLRVTSDVPGMRVLAMTRQTSLMEMSCSDENRAYNIPSAANEQDRPFIRMYNTGDTAGDVFGTLYGQNGTQLGRANSILAANLTPKSVKQLTAGDLASLVGAAPWAGRAWLTITRAPAGMRLMNILEDRASGNWMNASCVTGP